MPTEARKQHQTPEVPDHVAYIMLVFTLPFAGLMFILSSPWRVTVAFTAPMCL